MKRKLFLMVAIVAMLACLFAITASAAMYDTTKTVILDDGTSCALYDADGNALTYFLDDSGNLVSAKTVNVISVNNSGWVTYDGITAANVVVANFQEPSYETLIANKVSGLNISFRHSTNLEYVFLADEVKQFNSEYQFSNCDKMKVFNITENSELASFNRYIFHDCAVLEELYIPKGVTQLPNSNASEIGFASCCPKLTTVTFAEDSQLTLIAQAAFYKCTNLTNIVVPDTVEEVQLNAFRESGIVNSPFTANSQCTTFGKFIFRNCDSLKNFIVPLSLNTVVVESGYGPFSECDAIEKVTFGTYGDGMQTLPAEIFSKANIAEIVLPEGIKHISYRAFQDNKILKKLVFPNSVETCGERIFQNCSALETIVFGNSFKYFMNTGSDHHSFTYGASSVKCIYMPASFYEQAPETIYKVSYVFDGVTADCKFFYCGTVDEFAIAKENFLTQNSATSNNGKFTSAQIITYAEYLKNTEQYATGNYVICEYNVCDAFYNGEHNDVGNACVIDCERCDSYDGQMKENPVHSFTTTITYAGGFDNTGKKYELCSNEGCQYCEAAKETEVPAILFGYNGFSVPENASYKGITFGYDIDKTALSEYESYNKKLEMGFVVAVNAYLNGDDPLEADGSVALDTGVIKATFANEDTQGSYNRVDFVLKGDIWDVSIDIDGDEVLDTKVSDVEFLMCAYVIENGNVSYINKDVTSYSAELAKQVD